MGLPRSPSDGFNRQPESAWSSVSRARARRCGPCRPTARRFRRPPPSRVFWKKLLCARKAPLCPCPRGPNPPASARRSRRPPRPRAGGNEVATRTVVPRETLHATPPSPRSAAPSATPPGRRLRHPRPARRPCPVGPHPLPREPVSVACRRVPPHRRTSSQFEPPAPSRVFWKKLLCAQRAPTTAPKFAFARRSKKSPNLAAAGPRVPHKPPPD